MEVKANKLIRSGLAKSAMERTISLPVYHIKPEAEPLTEARLTEILQRGPATELICKLNASGVPTKVFLNLSGEFFITHNARTVLVTADKAAIIRKYNEL